MTVTPTQQGARQATVRASTGTATTYEGDWHALFDQGSIAAGTFNERLLRWINGQLSSAYIELNSAMQAFATSQGAFNWSSMGTFTIGGGGSSPSLDFSQADNSQYLGAI
jgi:hypothetical protein